MKMPMTTYGIDIEGSLAEPDDELLTKYHERQTAR